jgi:hypothetical protein
MEETSKPFERYLVLYVPWVLSILLKGSPVLSYFTAWLGSFAIFFICYSGWLKPLPKDREIAAQLMRPIFLVQIIFIGYMACSSIFYFCSQLGLLGTDEYLTNIIDDEKVELAAQCQRYYVLGHAAFVTGLVLSMKYPVKQKYKVNNQKLANILFTMAIVFLPVSYLAGHTPGLTQFYFQFTSLSFIAGTLALAFAIPLGKVLNTAFCLFLYLTNFYQALTSGFKEPIIISVLVLGIFLYPSYKRLVLMTFVPMLLILFAYLPTYNHIFRENAWGDNVDSDDAYKLALDAALSDDTQSDNTLAFLVFRISEIDMFTGFVKSTPEYVDFYGFDIVKQSLIVIVPRIFWPGKPITESLVMERVYNSGVIRRGSNVSAKPAYVVDAYLSGGALGVFLSLFIYGAAAQLISQKAEQLFGGYILGTALIFTGLFQVFWRGLSFEFLLNAVFWSYVTMVILSRVLRAQNILEDI